MKKLLVIIAMILSLLALLGILASCGKGEEGNTTATATATAGATEDPTTAAEVSPAFTQTPEETKLEVGGSGSPEEIGWDE